MDYKLSVENGVCILTMTREEYLCPEFIIRYNKNPVIEIRYIIGDPYSCYIVKSGIIEETTTTIF